jgi:hypothetical protein
MDVPATNLSPRILLLAPPIFICHFLEEAPKFVAWFNAHVARGITSELFWMVNFSALVITVILVGIQWFAPSGFSLSLVIAWFSFLMFANAIFHIIGSLVDKSYVPGLITAILLYLPYFSWLMMKIVKSGQLNISLVLGTAVLGAIPMCIHGYRILFLGSRLF